MHIPPSIKILLVLLLFLLHLALATAGMVFYFQGQILATLGFALAGGLIALFYSWLIDVLGI
jgi:hypothetical protein